MMNASALVPQIVPVQINLPQLLAIDPSSRSHALRRLNGL